MPSFSLLLLEFAELEEVPDSWLPNNDDCVALGCGGTAAGFEAGLRAAFLLGAAFFLPLKRTQAVRFIFLSK